MTAGRHDPWKVKQAAAVLVGFLVAFPAFAGPKAVIELYTSQGCSSCPPADSILATQADRADVIALSFSVDYWDYLGWADTLASRDNTLRQKAYAKMRGDRQVYTPQVIVDGKQHVIGNDRAAVDASIAKRVSGPGLPIGLRLSYTDDSVNLAVDGDASGETAAHATLWLMLFDNERKVVVSRGENSGRTLSYRNVVRKMQRVALWKGKPVSIDLPRAEMKAAGVDGCAVLLQTETEAGLPGRILGAAMVRFNPVTDDTKP